MKVDSEKLAAQCMKAALAITLINTVVLWGEWLAIAICWVLALPLAMLLSLIVGNILYYMGATMVKQNLWVDDADITIVERSPEIVGKLGENTIHEWVMLKRPDNGELVKCFYETVIDFNDWEQPDNRWFVVLDGGVLYVAEPNEKVEAEAAVARAQIAAAEQKVSQPENTLPSDAK